MPARKSGDLDRTFLARFGATILKGGIATIPAALFRYQAKLKLTPSQLWFVSALLARKWDTDLPHPSLRQMAAEGGVTVRYLQDIKAQLIDKEYLTVGTRLTTDGATATNSYDLSALLGKVEDLLEAEAKDAAAGGTNHTSSPESGTNHTSSPGVNPISSPPMNHSSPLLETDREEPSSLEPSSTPPTPQGEQAEILVGGLDQADERIFAAWQEATGHTRADLSTTRRKKIRDRLRDKFTQDELTLVVTEAWQRDPWRDRVNHNWIEQLLKSKEAVQKWLDLHDRTERGESPVRVISGSAMTRGAERDAEITRLQREAQEETL